jgi:hypothetical protein
MKRTSFFLIPFTIMFFFSFALQAQINLNRLGNKVSRKVEREIEKEIDKGIKNQNDKKDEEQKDAKAMAPSGIDIYVSLNNGSNKNDGTKISPIKNLDKAIKMSDPGSTIYVTGGIATGTFDMGYFESDKPLKIYGSWNDDFSSQDIKSHPTVIQPTNESSRSNSKGIMKFTKDVSGTVINHLIFDSGQRNAYHATEGIVEGVEGGRLLNETEKPPTGYPTIQEPLLQFMSATTGGDVTVENCVFANGASFAIQAGHRSGKFTVKNNVFVGNRMAAIEIYGTCANKAGPKDMTKCGEVEIANNTVLFTWSRLKDFLDMGYGVRIMTKCSYNIHHNIIGASILSGVDHTRFNKDEWISIDDNIFFVNKDEDLHYSPYSNMRLRINARDLEELEIASANGNLNEIPNGLMVDKAYLDGYLNALYSEKTDQDLNSSASIWRSMLGINQQGTMSSSVSMFCNRYPWEKASDLFGNVDNYGAQ